LYGEAVELGICFSSTMNWQEAPREGQYIIAPVWGSVNPRQMFIHHTLELSYSFQEGRGGSLTTVEWFF